MGKTKERKMSKSVVSIVKGDDPVKMVEEVLDHLGGVISLIKKGSTVVLKPNGGHPGSPETSINTSPALVSAVIKNIQKANPKKIIIAEAAAIGCDTMNCLEASGIKKAAIDAGVDDILDIKSDKDLLKIPIRDARSAVQKVLLPRFLVEAEHIVNLPIFKSHCSMVFTCALKNMKGVVQDKVHYQMHQTNLAEAMMDIWSVIKADLNIVDMIRPAEGFGPHFTMPTDFGCVIAGRDPVAVDATACRLTGLNLDIVPYFVPAHERGLGKFREEEIEIRGNTIQETRRALWLPYLEGFDKYPEYNIDATNACSSCLSLVGLTMERLKSLNQYDKNSEVTILVGRKKEIPEGIPPEKLILVGDCLKKFCKKGVHVEGCPPGEPAPHWAIVDRMSAADIDISDPEIFKIVRARMEEEAFPFIAHMIKLKAEWDRQHNNT
jgi:uncharacterized protein (DUF362 family)